MIHAVLADLLLVVHLAFVVYVVAGGLLVAWRRWTAWIHVPCAAYGVAIELFGWICPLTPLEQALRRRAGETGYEGGFVEHYLEGLLYPAGWGELRFALAAMVVIANVAVYAWIFLRHRKADASSPGDA